VTFAENSIEVVHGKDHDGVTRFSLRQSSRCSCLVLPCIAVGTPVTGRPPHRSRRAVFPHRALRSERSLLPQQSSIAVGQEHPRTDHALSSVHYAGRLGCTLTRPILSACGRIASAFIAPIPSPSLLDAGNVYAALPRSDYYESV
jgi:hypothetical protein